MNPISSSKHLNKIVFLGSSGAIIALLLFALLSPQLADQTFSQLQTIIVDNGSWFYVMTVAAILIFVMYLAVSRHSQIKLGPDHAEPDYSFSSWLSMLFAAGMGIGLMFFGVAEPLMHFLAPPTASPSTIEAAREAMKMTFFHWGLHAWAIYAVVALILAYFSYRHNLPLTLRSALYPIIGDKIYGWRGNVVDIFAVISTIFGVATSLGLGVLQISSGLNYLFGFPISEPYQLLLIVAITGLAIVSVVSGLDKGIRILSEFNMLLAIGLLVFILLAGPTVFLLQAMLQNTGAYLSDLVRNTFNLFAYDKKDWLGGWTIFYWGWWLAWAPFVGVFIARISKGRTIREFLIGVLLIPSMFTLAWMTIFGNSAIELVLNQGSTELAKLATDNTPVALFLFLEHFPWSNVISGVAVLMIVVFFVTSCDSGAMVVDMLCSNGQNDTPVWQRIYWAGGVGLVAGILLMAGGLSALQTMTIASALPFAVILLIAMYGLIKALRVEAYKRESMTLHAPSGQINAGSDSWKERLHTIVDFPNKSAVERFVEQTVNQAFDSVAKELTLKQIDADINQSAEAITLTVKHGEDAEFVYAVYPTIHHLPVYGQSTETPAPDSDGEHTYYRADVHLSEGGQNYDIMGWSKLAVINDIIDQYHRHLHFLHLAG
ncbi:BCCT family transporter [Paraglaciecola polaris]|uniref:Glycine betaine transporter opuD n=1 Tax=Paraglaciecola polaris LMG 21857 TaxID=1129793 RepID=K6Z407_9ALTE|nr:choline BCCT transporter BetT [Paraglaciecola polaris]GAC30956.1 glycine betaine transporter opuD [Paraglaciecola polaris LMG 21857]